MARFILTTVIALHGIIHLIGFSKEWKLGPGGKPFSKTLIPFSETGSKVVGVLWLAACVFMLASAYLYFQKKEWYWIPAVLGIVLSQSLIIIYWFDAKYGTIVNVVLLIVVILGYGVMSYNKLVRREIKSIITKTSDNQLITNEDIASLPSPVQRWLSKSGVMGKQIPQYVHVVQRGSMRTKPDSDWMAFTADQYFTIQEPAFVWSATMKASVIPIAGRDKFIDGHGNMLIKPLYVYEMANSSGPQIDQGTLLRYLAEMMWFPHAAISDYLTWEQIDNTRASVTMNYKGVSATGTFTFNNEGDVIGFEAMRYGDFDGEYRKELWSIVTTNHKSFQGIHVGTTSQVTWKLKTGDFLWLKLEIDDISYNNEELNK
jgi:hypothetical protein